MNPIREACRASSRHALAVASVLALAPLACGGGGAADLVPPSLVAATPAPGATEVDVEAHLVLRFSEALARESVTPDTITVRRRVPSLARGWDDVLLEPVAGALTYDAATYTVTFAADPGLALRARYRVDVTSAVRDRAGNPLEPVDPIELETRDGRLAGAAKVGADPVVLDATRSAGPFLSVTSHGDALLVWSDVLSAAVPAAAAWFSRYDAATETWSAQAPVIDPAARSGSIPAGAALGGDGTGYVLVGPSQDRQGDLFVLAARRGGEWERATTLVESSAPHASNAVLAMDGLGDVLAAWTDQGVAIARFDAALGVWAPTLRVPGNSEVRLAANASGHAIASWRRGVPVDPEDASAGLALIAEALRYDPATGSWGAPVRVSGLTDLLPTGGSASPAEPHLAIDRAGNAIVAWSELDGEDYSGLWTARYDSAARTWSAPFFHGRDGHFGVAMDSHGDALALWNDGGFYFDSDVYDSRAASWQASGPTRTELSTTMPTDLVAVDSGGRAAAIACDTHRFGRLTWLRREPGAAWGPEEELSPQSAAPGVCALGFDARDRAVLAWRIGGPEGHGPMFVDHWR
jgi:hypothetical protein